jgi:hypothetical protein
MSADIEKMAVFDSRIVQSRPKYAVEKGALSLTNAPFNAIAATASQHTYNIYVPSENVYVDRAIEWSSTVYMTYAVQLESVEGRQGQAVVVQGRDWSLCAFPLNAMCSTQSATINDTTAVINTQDVLYEVLRLTDYKKNRLQRTCPTMLDKYMYYADADGAVNNPIGPYTFSSESSEMPNGAFYNVVYTDPNGNPLGTSANGGNDPAFPGALYGCVNGIPVINGLNSQTFPAVPINLGTSVCPTPGLDSNYENQALTGNNVPIYFRWRSTEKLVLSPFVFSDCHEWDTGLFGINNIQLVMNLQAPTRLVRSNYTYGRDIQQNSIAFFNGSGGTPFSRSVVNCLFLTPSLDVPLPPKSVVPYMEFPRYITQYQNGYLEAGATGQIQSQTITLPQIPDLFIIYVKNAATPVAPNNNSYASYEGDWRFPLASSIDGVNNPLTINFDNFSGLLSSVTAEQLYAMSVKNGLDMDWNEWIGIAKNGDAVPQQNNPGVRGDQLATAGGILVLKPSQDITLQTGQAPSLVGNFTFQFNITVKNNSANTAVPQLFVITANSGFFETIRGSSRIIKGVLSEQDIISAPLAPTATRDMLQRHVGAGMMGSMANSLSKVKDMGSSSRAAPAMAAAESGRKGLKSRM